MQVVTVPLSFDDGYRLDVNAIADRLTSRTKLVSVASPQNPSGVRVHDEDVEYFDATIPAWRKNWRQRGMLGEFDVFEKTP